MISGGTISGSTISGATITGGNISGANISGATIAGGTISGAEISGGDIRGGDIQGGGAVRPADGAGGAPPAGAAPGAAPSGAAPPPRPPSSAGRGRGERPDRKENAAPRSQARAPADAEHKAAGSGGGDDEEEEAAARALQRALVQRGALLLPVWSVEVVPSLQYGHGGEETVTSLPATQGAPSTTLAVRTRTHQMIGSLTVRVGLPWELQAEASVPALRAWNDVALSGPGLVGRNDASGIGFGDPRLSLTRQLVRAHRSIPDVLVTGTWKPALGTSPFDAPRGRVGLGSGYAAVGGTITASKAADPLVFVASASYMANLPTSTSVGRRDPGDTFGLGAGAVLAVSPETSLSFLLDFHFKPEDRLKGTALIGSDTTDAVLQIGIGSVLSRRTLLNFSVGIGLTPDAPRFQLGMSLPLRF